MPVFMITGKYSLSPVEPLAYLLQNFRRAAVVGEQTTGMAHPSRIYPVGGRFVLTAPFLIARYGRSGQTFAGGGVTPDMGGSDESALDVAMEEFRRAPGSSHH